MKTAIRLLLAITVALFPLHAIAASFDLGVSLGDSTGISADQTGAFMLEQKNSGNLWFQAALGDSLMFTTQVGARYVLDPFLLAVDADSLNLQGVFPSTARGAALFRFTLGRTRFTDFTGLVLDQKADGLLFDFEFPVASVTVSAAFTGLLTKTSSTIALSKADANDAGNTSVFFAPPRLFQAAQLAFPALLGQRLTISGIFQEDLRDTVFDLATPLVTDNIAAGSTVFDPARGGPVNTQYFGLGLSGTIVSSLYYDMYSYLQTGQVLTYSGVDYAPAQILAFMAGGGLRYYLPSVLFSVFSAKFFYVSGDADSTTTIEGNTQGTSTSFAPISRPTLAQVFSPQLSNIMVAEAGFSLKPLSWLGQGVGESLQVALKSVTYIRSSTGAISEPGVLNTDAYLGTEADLSAVFRPFSDLGLTLTGGVFIPGSAFGANPVMRYKAGAELSLSF